jgi:crossover junction endodeoxyribonuclease RuvC
LSDRVRILGIDPGSRITGYGIVDVAGGDPVHVSSGCLRVGRDDFAARLHAIFTGLSALVAEFGPDEVAIERVFLSRNPDSALKLGQARGAALCATFARADGAAAVPVFEYSATQIKQAVAGRGRAEKAQVQRMVQILLGTDGAPQADAADALAAALCRAYTRRAQALVGEAVGKGAAGQALRTAGRRSSWRSWRP